MVEGVPGVVPHAAVHRNIGADTGDSLNRAHLIEGDPRRPHNGTPRLQKEEGGRKSQLFTAVPHHRSHLFHIPVVSHWVVLRYVPDAETASQVQLPQNGAGLPADKAHKLQHHLDGKAEGIDLKDLGTNVAVEADKPEVFGPQGQLDSGQGFPCLQGKAELAIDLAGADKLVGVGVDARLDPKHHWGGGPFGCRKGVQGPQFGEVVRHDPAHPVLQGHGQLLRRFVAAVEDHLVHGKIRRLCGVQLPGGYHVQPQALLLYHAADSFAAEGLGSVSRQAVPPVKPLDGTAVEAAVLPDGLLAHNKQRGSVFLGQGQGVPAADGKVPQAVYRKMFPS